MPTYENWQSSQPNSPSWFLQPIGAAFLRCMGRIKDDLLNRGKDAVKARMPSYAEGAGLDAIGWARQIYRAPSETNEDYSVRVREAWETWKFAGTHYGILRELKGQGFPTGPTGAHVLSHSGRYSYLAADDSVVFGDGAICINRKNLLDAAPGNLPGFTFDWRDQFYTRIVVFFPQDVPTLRPGTQDAQRCLDSVLRWKPAKSLLVGIHVLETGNAWGWPTTRTWGSGTWGGTVHQITP